MSENAAADYKMFDLRGIDWPEVSPSRTPSGIRVNADNSMACSAYTACIRVISDAVSALPLHVYERLANGEDMATVVRLGSERRLRPVLMTAIITALGMVPLLFATGPGSEIQKPLAIVVTGGLVSATLLTLLLLPLIFERWSER